MEYKPRVYQPPMTDFALNNERCNVFARMGAGKGASTLDAISQLLMFNEVRRVLVLGPRLVALHTWPGEVKQFHESFGHMSIAAAVGTPAQRIAAVKSNPQILTANYDIVEWLVDGYGDRWPFDMVVADECFVAGTKVVTPFGERPIESVRVGDLVTTLMGPKRVVRTIKKEVSKLVRVAFSDGRTVLCTLSHRFRTRSSWVEASELNGHKVVCLTSVQMVQRAVRYSCGKHGDRGSRWLLRKIMRDERLVVTNPERNFAASCEGLSEVHQKTWTEQQRCADVSRDEGVSQCYRKGSRRHLCKSARWKRERYESGRESRKRSVGSLRMDLELPCADQTGMGQVRLQDAKLLQAGLCKRGKDDVFRSRRIQPRHHLGKRARRKENIGLGISRVESVSHIQPRSPVSVFDLEVESAHHYFVEGKLVHNCGRLAGHRVGMRTSVKGKEYTQGQGSVRAAALAKVAHKYVRRYVGLNGSPAPNGLPPLWAQCWFVDGGKRLGRSFSAFQERWFRHFTTDSGYSKLEPFPTSQKEIEDAIRDVCLTVDPRPFLNARTLIEHNVFVHLPPKARKHYDEVQKDLFTMLREGRFVEAFNEGGKVNKCLQLGSWGAYTDTETREYEITHTEKLQALESIVSEAAGESLLIRYCFQPERDMILKAFPAFKPITAPNAMQDFQEGRLQGLVVHAASAGHGISLQKNCRTLVDFSSNYNFGEDEQIIERVGPTRQAQSGFDRDVYRYRIIAKDTIEETSVLPVLAGKMTVQDSLLAAMMR